MRCTCNHDQVSREDILHEVRQSAYESVISWQMSRAERRTAHGRMLVAQAAAAALKAEVEFLKNELAAWERQA